MRIGVDARPLREKQTSGIPRYVSSLLTALFEIDKQNEYVLYAHKDFDFPLKPNSSKKFGALTRYGSVWMQAELPHWLKRDGIDIFWGTQHILPLAMPKTIRSVLTVHDLVHYVFPETMRLMNLIINKLIIPPSVHRADAIVADTQWTMDDVKRFINPQPKISEVIHLGISPVFYPRDIQQAREKIKSLYHLNSPFLLTLGTFEPRKNIKGIFKAFSLVADKIPHNLAVVGQKGWKNKNILKNITGSSVAKRIHLLGYLEDSLIPEIYSAADVFLFPSLYEGFGLPLLEAMACGTPVISSNVSSIPEVVGDAAHLVNPHEPERIAEAILNVVNNMQYKQKLISSGIEQAKKFKWEKAARLLLGIFEKLR